MWDLVQRAMADRDRPACSPIRVRAAFDRQLSFALFLHFWESRVRKL